MMLDKFSILTIAGLIILLFLYYGRKRDNQNEKFQNYDDLNINVGDMDISKFYNEINNELDVSSIKNVETKNNKIYGEQLYPNFNEIQFNTDYRDVITALNDLIPDNRQIFNIANIPTKQTEYDINNVYDMMEGFIKKLNKYLAKMNLTINPSSGWDSALPNPSVKSGFDAFQESLGIPPLWSEIKGHHNIRLIKITNVTRYETEDQIKHSIDFVVMKNLGKKEKKDIDQMIIKIDIVQNKFRLDEEKYFEFAKEMERVNSGNIKKYGDIQYNNNNSHVKKLPIHIEYIYIVGYLSRRGGDRKYDYDGQSDKYYDLTNFDAIGNNDNYAMITPTQIQKTLMDKYGKQRNDMNQYISLLDDESKQFHKELSPLYLNENIAQTQTIFDDMNNKRIFT